MSKKIRVLIAEKDMLLASDMAMQLVNMGYEVSGIESRGEDALSHCRNKLPDIILIAIDLGGALDGVATAAAVKDLAEIPVVFLTENDSEEVFDKARSVHPHAFISKPFNKLQFKRIITLVGEQVKFSKDERPSKPREDQQLKDRIFIRHHGKMVRLYLDEIRYVEADRNYCRIITDATTYLLVTTLKALSEQLPHEKFVRVHRSYVVNLDKLDCISEHHLEIARKVIPVSRSHRDSLMARLHTL